MRFSSASLLALPALVLAADDAAHFTSEGFNQPAASYLAANAPALTAADAALLGLVPSSVLATATSLAGSGSMPAAMLPTNGPAGFTSILELLSQASGIPTSIAVPVKSVLAQALSLQGSATGTAGTAGASGSSAQSSSSHGAAAPGAKPTDFALAAMAGAAAGVAGVAYVL